MSALRGAYGFFEYAQERYHILLRRRRGEPWPWTSDKVLQEHAFCNVFREDDKTTMWFASQIRQPLYELAVSLNDRAAMKTVLGELIMAVVAFRWFNRIETGKRMMTVLCNGWDAETAKRLLGDVKPLITGAYMVKSPPGMSKLDGLCWCIDNVHRDIARITDFICKNVTLADAHKLFMGYPYLGSFMSYEIVTDLAQTPLLMSAADVNAWAAAGPGAARGMGWITSDNLNVFRYTSPRDQSALNLLMQELLDKSKDPMLWPSGWPQWDMRTVEHTLCEYDKYRRGLAGQKLKRRYKR